MVEKFNDIRTYREISFENNGIVELKKSRISNFYARTVEIFNVENNLIKEIEDGCFETMHSLTNLNLARNQLETINSNWFTGLDQTVETLDLSGNKISKIPDNAFIRLKSLKNVTLDRNPIRIILPGSFSGQDMLQSLALSYTELSEIPDSALSPVANLETLSFRFGRIERLPQLKLPVLKRVDFSGNPVETIEPYTFINASQLTTILFDLMPELSKIAPNAFAYLTNMQYLQISGSLLLRNISKSAFEPDFGFGEFFAVDFSNNSLTDLPEELFYWNAVKTISLAGNPWSCSCKISWMLQSNVNILDISKCSYPVDLAQQPIRGLVENNQNNKCVNLTKSEFSPFEVNMNWTDIEHIFSANRLNFTIPSWFREFTLNIPSVYGNGPTPPSTTN